MNVVSTVCRSTGALLLAGLGVFLLTSCSDVTKTDLSNLYPSNVQGTVPSPVVDQTVVQQVISQSTTNAVPLLPATTDPTVLNDVKQNTVVLQNMSLTPSSGSAMSTPTVSSIQGLPTAQQPTTPVTAVGFQVSSTIQTGDTTTTVTAPTLVTLQKDPTNGNNLVMANSAALPPGDTTLDWGAVTSSGFAASDDASLNDAADLSLDDLGLSMSRQAVVAPPGLKIRRLQVKTSVNKGTHTWTLPSYLLKTNRDATTGKYKVAGTTLTLNWDGIFRVPPVGGMASATVVLYNRNTVGGPWSTVCTVVGRQEQIVNNTLSIVGTSPVEFNGIAVFIDLRNQATNLDVSATLPAPVSSGGQATMPAGFTVAINSANTFSLSSAPAMLGPNGSSTFSTDSTFKQISLNSPLSFPTGNNTLALTGGYINAGLLAVKNLTFKFTDSSATSWTLPSTWALHLGSSGQYAYQLLNGSYMQITWNPAAGANVPADGKVVTTVNFYMNGNNVGTATTTSTIVNGSVNVDTSSNNAVSFNAVDVTIDARNTKN